VEADPIIWENRVRPMKFSRVLDNYYIYAFILQRVSEVVKLLLSLGIDSQNLRLLVFLLEVVIEQGHLVGTEVVRADHDDGISQLLA